MIEYKKMSLFDAPEGSYIVHACNAQGVWGSGIAKEFKERFPESYNEYADFCEQMKDASGYAFTADQEKDHSVVCLITSKNYGNKVDNPLKILENTQKALNDLIQPGMPAIFYSNKFNSGLFKVPWEDTEKLIKEFTDRLNIDWVVCNSNLKD